jgi:hypothetical protein
MTLFGHIIVNEVFSEGVSEWEALDKLPVYATEVQWSLIYRKLKGKRGCTPLLPGEAENLINMVINKNGGNPIAKAGYTGGFDWDFKGRKIKTTQSRKDYPNQRNYNFDSREAIFYIKNSHKSFDAHLNESQGFKISRQYLRRNRSYENYLQLYFTEKIEIDATLNPIVGNKVIWFGNEVACSVGMRKIDILTICQEGERKQFRLIELKDEPVKAQVIEQLEFYVNWASQNSGRHLEGAFDWNLQPIVVAPPHKSRNWLCVVDAFKSYNRKRISLPILYFEFTINSESAISFQKIEY